MDDFKCTRSIQKYAVQSYDYDCIPIYDEIYFIIILGYYIILINYYNTINKYHLTYSWCIHCMKIIESDTCHV